MEHCDKLQRRFDDFCFDIDFVQYLVASERGGGTSGRDRVVRLLSKRGVIYGIRWYHEISWSNKNQ